MLAQWNEWYTLLFLLPLGLALVMLVASALTGGGGDDGDADPSGFDGDAGDFTPDLHGMGTDAGDLGDFHPADGDVDLDTLDADGGTDLDDGPAGSDSHAVPFHHQAMGFFGVGRASLTLLLQGFMLFWGVTGIYANQMLSARLHEPARFVPVSILLAGIAGLLGMKLIGAIGSRYMKSVETYVVGGDDLAGEIGTVTYPVTETTGRVHVYDRHGTLHIESCRTEPGAEPIPRNAQALLLRHEADKGYYRVERSPENEGYTFDTSPK